MDLLLKTNLLKLLRYRITKDVILFEYRTTNVPITLSNIGFEWMFKVAQVDGCITLSHA